MRRSKKPNGNALTFAIFLFSCFINASEAVLFEDLTAIPEFGCQWSGGSLNSGVTCICQSNAQELYIQRGLIPSYDATKIKIENCNAVRFGPLAISDMRNLRNIHLSNIKNLVLEDSSLSWNTYIQTTDLYSTWDGAPTLKIKVEKSIINTISSYTFQGRISTISFEDSQIKNISPFAFSSLLHSQIIEFVNVGFNKVQAQAFKKFPTQFLLFNNSTFDLLPSRSFSDIVVSNTLQIHNCVFDTIRSAAFLITNPKRFEIINCRVNLLEGEGFKVESRGGVQIKHNFFNMTNGGAFMGMAFNKGEIRDGTHREEILFGNNTFVHLERRSLLINSTSFSVKYTNTLIQQDCNCQFLNYNLELGDMEEVQCLYTENKRIAFKEFIDDNCSVLAGYETIVIVLGVVLGLVLVIFFSLLFYYKMFYKKHKCFMDNRGKPVSLIMPDGRTYRETELHVVVERTDLLTTAL